MSDIRDESPESNWLHGHVRWDFDKQWFEAWNDKESKWYPICTGPGVQGPYSAGFRTMPGYAHED